MGGRWPLSLRRQLHHVRGHYRQRCCGSFTASLPRTEEPLLYITFDLDCLDPTVASAVANLEAGREGFRIDEVMRLLRRVRAKNVIGGDAVCLMPNKDHPNQITAHTAAAIMFEIVSLVADRFRG